LFWVIIRIGGLLIREPPSDRRNAEYGRLNPIMGIKTISAAAPRGSNRERRKKHEGANNNTGARSTYLGPNRKTVAGQNASPL
jgi:hypothetical protein